MKHRRHHAIHRPHDPWQPRPMTLPAVSHALLTLEQWHAVRDSWPARMPVGVSCRTTPTSRRSPPTCRASRWSRCSSRSGPTAAPTARPACCARAALRRRGARHRRRAGRHAAAAAAHRLRRGAAARRPERSSRASARCASSPATTRATCTSRGRCSRGSRGMSAMSDAIDARTRAHNAAASTQRVAHARRRCCSSAADASTPAASCRPPAWAPRTWCSPT